MSLQAEKVLLSHASSTSPHVTGWWKSTWPRSCDLAPVTAFARSQVMAYCPVLESLESVESMESIQAHYEAHPGALRGGFFRFRYQIFYNKWRNVKSNFPWAHYETHPGALQGNFFQNKLSSFFGTPICCIVSGCHVYF